MERKTYREHLNRYIWVFYVRSRTEYIFGRGKRGEQ